MSRVRRNDRLHRRKLLIEGLERREVLTAYFVDGDALPGGTGSEDAPFATIRQAVEAALVNPNVDGTADEVVIAPKSSGFYVEPLYIAPGYSPEQIQGFDQFNGDLVIRGATGRAADVVLTSNVGSDIYLAAPINITIKDLTLGPSAAHGLVNRSPNDVVVDNVVARDHLLQSPSQGSGIVHQGAHMTIRDSDVFNNYQGIWLGTDLQSGQYTPGSLTVVNTSSHNNRWGGLHVNNMTGSLTTVGFTATDNRGAGLSIASTPSVSISGGSISGNVADGVYLSNVGQTTIDSVDVHNNGGAGVYAEQLESISISAGSFSNNIAQGISLNNVRTSASVTGVHADWNKRTGLANTDVHNLLISGGSFSHNTFKGLGVWSGHGATIDGVLIEYNGKLTGNDSTGGAGIRVEPLTGEPILITNSMIRYNETNYSGGGFIMANNRSDILPTVTFANTTLSENKTKISTTANWYGGGIDIAGYANLKIIDSVIEKNQATTGGGVYFESMYGTVTIDRSTIDNNTGRAVGGLNLSLAKTVSISNSTISNNHSTIGAAGLALKATDGAMTNVTVSGNVSQNSTGGVSLDARYPFGLVNSTIVNNSGSTTGGLDSTYAVARMANTVIASNHVPGYPYYQDIRGSIQSQGGNFIGNATWVQGWNSSDRTGFGTQSLDPQLSPLQDNGGPTLTHLPLLGSPLVNRGVSSAVGIPIPTTDQRGVARPQRGVIDIGAVEVENNAPTVVAAASSVSVDEGQIARNNGTYADLDGDRVTMKASVGFVNVSPNGTWQWALNTYDGPSAGTTVTITAQDSYGAVTTIEFEVVVNNVPPTAQVSATSPVVSGQATTLTLDASDPSPFDTYRGFTYQIDWDSNGTWDSEVRGGTVTVSHVFTALGTHTITVVAIDKDGGVSQPVTTEVTVVPAPLVFLTDSSVNLNGAVNGKKPISVVVPSTATFDARSLDVATVVWAGAHVSSSTYLDVDEDGDIDAVFDFVLADSDVLDLYAQALSGDPSNNHQSITTELTAVGSDGTNYLGSQEVDFFMTGKALRDLLDSM